MDPSSPSPFLSLFSFTIVTARAPVNGLWRPPSPHASLSHLLTTFDQYHIVSYHPAITNKTTNNPRQTPNPHHRRNMPPDLPPNIACFSFFSYLPRPGLPPDGRQPVTAQRPPPPSLSLSPFTLSSGSPRRCRHPFSILLPLPVEKVPDLLFFGIAPANAIEATSLCCCHYYFRFHNTLAMAALFHCYICKIFKTPAALGKVRTSHAIKIFLMKPSTQRFYHC
ncbi:putative protein isoform X1 [Capsicum chacoense]|uniref:uncharacterized protein LOC107854429 isoform X1 n=1 Tax=Capsicum annuum TaxID=4072 RepID=UPI001FB17D9A|nr:uncharacterized protein LOC107854429 isoform X1 [Capsicum annuum]